MGSSWVRELMISREQILMKRKEIFIQKMRNSGSEHLLTLNHSIKQEKATGLTIPIIYLPIKWWTSSRTSAFFFWPYSDE